MFQGLFDIINIPLGYVMRFLANIFSNDFAAAVAVFTLVINVILIPLSIKSQKSSVQQMRIKPKMDELRKKYGDDRQKMAEAQQKLYQEENVSMSGGCLPMLIRLALMMSIYWLIMSPLTYIAQVAKSDVTTVSNAIIETLNEYKENDADKYEEFCKRYEEIVGTKGMINGNVKSASARNVDLMLTNIVRNDPDFVKDLLPEEKYKEIEKAYTNIIEKDKVAGINYLLFGNEKIDLTKTPKFSLNIFNDFQLLWLIPIGAFLAQMLTSLISMKINKINNPEAPSMMGMMLTMPLISLFIGFGLPGGVGFYWICSSLIGGLIQSGVQLWYGPQKLLARERAKELSAQCDFEAKQLEKFNSTVEE